MNGKYHKVVAGDCMSNIADRYGFFWQSLWNHSENAELKARRENPNVNGRNKHHHPLADKRMKR